MTRTKPIAVRGVAVAAVVMLGCSTAYAQQTSCRSARAYDPIPLTLPVRPTAASVVDIPASIRAEHRELWADLDHATVCPGAVGEAARAVAALLRLHFTREEQIALPPLGLLYPLAKQRITPEMAAILPITDSLVAELPRMREEHKAIWGAAEQLAEVAEAEMRPEQVRLARRLQVHVLTEEEVLYPAAVLVGNYLKVRLGTLSSGTPERR